MSQKKEYSPEDIDKWFDELLNSEPVPSKVEYRLADKVLDDFHGHAPIIDDSYAGKLPTITPKAQIFITQNLPEGQFFRFGVEGGGCSGFNYLFDIAENKEEGDIQFFDSPPAVIDEQSLQFLYGSTIDLEDSNMNKLLKVDNPGAKASCGCGTSFAFDEELLDIYG